MEFSDPQAFLRFLDTDTPDVRHVSIINDHLVEVHYQHQEKDIPVYPNVNIFVACFNTSCARHLTKGLLSAIFFHTPTKVNVNRLKARREAPWRIKGFIPSGLLRMMEKMEEGEGGTPNPSSFVFGFQSNTNPSSFVFGSCDSFVIGFQPNTNPSSVVFGSRDSFVIDFQPNGT